MPQKTLVRAAVMYGQGLHTGRKSGLIFEPLGPGTGIHFVGCPKSGRSPPTSITSGRP
jgi:UDP-3-O-acyl-N-acetylglucosamine deacetylase